MLIVKIIKHCTQKNFHHIIKGILHKKIGLIVGNIRGKKGKNTVTQWWILGFVQNK